MSTNQYPPMRPEQWAEFGSVEAWHRYCDETREATAAYQKQYRAKLQAEQDAIAAEALAARDNAAEEAIEQYRQSVRVHWQGTQAQFDAAWPRLREDWQVRQAQAGIEAEMERMRATGKYSL